MLLQYDLSRISIVCLGIPFVVLREDSNHTEMVEWHYLYERERASEREKDERASARARGRKGKRGIEKREGERRRESADNRLDGSVSDELRARGQERERGERRRERERES